MKIFSKKIIFILFLFFGLLGSFFYFRSQVYYSKGSFSEKKVLEISKGDGNKEVAEKLFSAGIISGKNYFYYYLKTKELSGKIMPGVYEFYPGMTIPDVARAITSEEEKALKITFPEGWDARKMAERLNQNGLPGDEFLKLVLNPGELKNRYAFLKDEKVLSLEGYLFPDTYYFKKDARAEDIIVKILDTFDIRFDEQMRNDSEKYARTLSEIVTMASIVEREVQTAQDMKIASGIFWKRLDAKDLLQSDATLSYFLNDKKDQHSKEELEIDSPYNSYKYPGLPPTPIGNPGKNALLGAIYPEKTDYYFFLTVSSSGKKEVIYSKNFQEHVANRNKYGI